MDGGRRGDGFGAGDGVPGREEDAGGGRAGLAGVVGGEEGEVFGGGGRRCHFLLVSAAYEMVKW